MAPYGQAVTHSPHPTQASSFTVTTPVSLFFEIALGLTGQARTQAGRSQCWHESARKSKALLLSESSSNLEPNQTTRLCRSVGPRACSDLHAASQLLQPVHLSRSIIKANLGINPNPQCATSRLVAHRRRSWQKM